MSTQGPSSSTKPYRVLTIDGGGIRGIYTAALFRRLGTLFQRDAEGQPVELDLGQGFDLICGTSTGSILAAALAKGLGLQEVIDLYRTSGPKIFPKPMPPLSPRHAIWWLKYAFRPSGKAQPLREELSKWFKEETMASVFEDRGIGLCIQAVNAVTGKPKVFKTPHHPKKIDDNDVAVVDAVMASSAAPTYLPVHRFTRSAAMSSQEFVDGGLWANNPVLVGLLEALQQADPQQSIQILSAGTCSEPKRKQAGTESVHRGLVKWKGAADILDLSMRSQSEAFSHMANHLVQALGCHGRKITVFRLHQEPVSPDLVQYLALDRAEPKAMDCLIDLAENDAVHNHTMSNAMEEPAAILHDIFTTLPRLERRKEP